MKFPTTLLGCLLLVSLTTAQSWVRQNPFPQLAVMQDIDFDGLFGIAAGDESTLFTTTNGGTTWVPRNLPQAGLLYQAVLVVPGSAGQFLLAGGYDVVISRDGGQTWHQANINAALVYKIQALPDGSIIVLDADNSWRSIDQGATWEPVNMPGSNITAGHFTSASNGWVQYGGFENNQVWVTTDGGASWNLRDPLKHPIISEIQMLNDQVGFMGSRDFVYKTTDGGNSWVKMHDTPAYSILDLHAINENEIWTCQNNGFVFYTLDGGSHWQETDPAIINSNRTNAIYANEQGSVWVAGKYVSLLHSPDNGLHWSDQIPNAKGTMYMPHFFNEDIGLVGSSEGVVLRTTNGGASWDKIQLDETENFFAVQMVTAEAMVIGSSSGRVFGSLNQGDTWTMIGENLGQVTDLHVFNLQSAILANESGTIYKTDNGGAQWDIVYGAPEDILMGIDFAGPQSGWACGWNGQILHTENGGDTWISQYHDGHSQFSAIAFPTELEGWVVSSSFTDTIWHTTNGGADWLPSLLPARTFWRAVSFASPDTGWVAGGGAGSGIILRTNDGGQTWISDHQSPEALLGLYAIPQKETVWGTGFGGNIVKYSPCSFSPTLYTVLGETSPCQRDTITYTVESSDVDLFEWLFPADWLVYGNSNTSSIRVIAGAIPGEITVTGKDACGEATDTLTLNTIPFQVPEAVIVENNGVLTCETGLGSYQWLLDGSAIEGATGQSYSPVTSGTYEVVVTISTSGCESRSNAIIVIINATGEIQSGQLDLFPNPVSDLLSIVLKGDKRVSAGDIMVIINSEGRIISGNQLSECTVDVSMLPAGLYTLVLKNDQVISRQKFVICR